MFIYQFTNTDDLASVQRYSLHIVAEKVVQFTLGKKFPLPLPSSPLLRDDMFSDGAQAVVMQPTSGQLIKLNDKEMLKVPTKYSIDKVLKFDCEGRTRVLRSICFQTKLAEGNQCQILTDGQLVLKESMVRVMPQSYVKVEFQWKARTVVEGQKQFEAALCIVPVQTLKVEDCCTVLLQFNL